MHRRRLVAAFTVALLLPALVLLQSCSNPACKDGGEGCPCTTGVECGRPPACTGWMCDGTCHSFNERVGFRCAMDLCTGPGNCPGVCDGRGTCVGCLQDGDCAPGHTCEAGSVCSECDDGIQNGDETGVDCGGSCPLCPGTCNTDADCGEGGYCWQGLCARCDDGIKNGNEHDVDCSLFNDGGRCPLCYGGYCMQDADCASGACEFGACCKEPCPVCYDCSLKTGECFPVGNGVADTVVGGSPGVDCVGDYMCNGTGKCGLTYGKPCTQNEECAHENCVNGFCD